MIDTHSHLLPWVDHGCPDLATSLLMAREAAESGVSTVVCTPHLPEWNESEVQRVRVAMAQVRQAVLNAGIDLELLLGFEVDLGIAATVRTEKLGALAIEGSGGALVLEMPYTGWPVFIEETIFRLTTAGFVPVLAHPERNDRIQDSSELLVGCLKSGAVAQATAGSLGGEFGRASVRTFRRLISEGLISLLASDAHAHRIEGWTMVPMLATLEGALSTDELLMLTETNPRRLLAGEKVLPLQARVEVKPQRGRPRRPRLG